MNTCGCLHEVSFLVILPTKNPPDSRCMEMLRGAEMSKLVHVSDSGTAVTAV